MKLEQQKVKINPVYISDLNSETFSFISKLFYVKVSNKEIVINSEYFYQFCEDLEKEIEKYHNKDSTITHQMLLDFIEIINIFTTEVQHSV